MRKFNDNLNEDTNMKRDHLSRLTDIVTLEMAKYYDQIINWMCTTTYSIDCVIFIFYNFSFCINFFYENL